MDLALELGADYLGFIVYPQSPRGIALERAVELAARVPVGKRVLVDVDSSVADLRRYEAAGFDYFQLHGRHAWTPDVLAGWQTVCGPERLWLAPRLAPDEPFPKMVLEYADTVLVDTYTKGQVGGTGQTGDWGRYAELTVDYPQKHFILAGGLRPENVLAAIQASGTAHVDVNSGVEFEPGKKDPEKLRELFRVLRA